jgi:hypothetical protein
MARACTEWQADREFVLSDELSAQQLPHPNDATA